MKLAIIILKEEQKLEILIDVLEEKQITDITILDSHTIVKGKATRKVRTFSSIRHLLNFVYDESRVLLIPINSKELEVVKETFTKICKPEHYTLYTLNIDGEK